MLYANEVMTMTIIETLFNIAINNAVTFTEEEQDAMAEVVLAMQELEWYRGQDLIRRDVVLSAIEDICFEACTEDDKRWKCVLYDNCGDCKTQLCEKEIEQIPKAEYKDRSIAMDKPKNICCICGREFTGHGNNPWPVVDSMLECCCDTCSSDIVIPARLKQYMKEDNNEDCR